MADGVWTFELCDQTDNVLADVTHLITSTVSPRLNRPLSYVLKGPADQDEWRTIHSDGYRYLVEGLRTIKARRNGVLRGNAEVWRLDYSGDENSQQVQITCFDSMTRLAARLVYDSLGEVADWQFPSSIAAGDLVQQLFENAATYEEIPAANPRTFPLDHTSGAFIAASDVADLLSDGPTPMGDLIYTRICDTGVADVVCVPTDTAAGSPAGVYGIVHCVDAWGSDLTGSVHFDYDTGDRTVKAIRRSFDMTTVSNKLRYLLGPKISNDHWRGSVESSDEAHFGTLAYRDAEYASRNKYGTLAIYEVFDSDANAVRALYEALFKTETTLRINARELVYLTPAANCTFAPFDDYNAGDLVAGNLADTVGPAASNQVQRIYGFDLTVDKDGVESPGELIVSPDGAS